MNISIDLDHISFSCIDLYHTCPFAWYQAYVKGIRDTGNHYSAFGSHMHQILEDWGKARIEGKAVELEHMLKQNLTSFPLDSFTSSKTRMEFQQLGIDILERFYKHDGHIKPLLIEHKGELLIPDLPPLTLYIDRIDGDNIEDSSTWSVQDYKTGRTFTQKKVDEHLQLSIYAMFVKQKHGKLPKELVYKFLKLEAKRTGYQIREAVRTEEDLKKAIEKIYLFWNDVQAEKFEPNCSNPYFCDNFCFYRKKHLCTPKRVINGGWNL